MPEDTPERLSIEMWKKMSEKDISVVIARPPTKKKNEKENII